MKRKDKKIIVDDDLLPAGQVKKEAENIIEAKTTDKAIPVKISENSTTKKQPDSFLIDDRFAIQTVIGVIIVKYDDILLFELPKHKRNWTIFFIYKKWLTLRATISSKDILSINPSFIQINQNCIINIKYLASIENRTYKCFFYPPYDETEAMIKPKYFKQLKELMHVL